MLAAVLEKFNTPLSLINVDSPENLGVGQVEVEVHYTTICGAQLREMSGAKGEDPYLPHCMGHEGSGIVTRIGAGVKTVEVGDHVVMHWRKGAGIDADLIVYNCNAPMYTVGGGPVHTFAERPIVSENRVTTIKKNFPLNLAPLLGCALTTGFGLINNEAKVKIGQTVAVIGCGGVGLFAVLGARIAGASQVIAIDTNKNAITIANIFGASLMIIDSVTSEKVIQNNWRSCDVVVETTGNPDVIKNAFALVRAGGKLILVGQPPAGCTLNLTDPHKQYRGIQVMDSQGGLTNPAEDIPRYVDYILEWKTFIDKGTLENVIMGEFPLKGINNAIDHVKNGLPGKVRIKVKS